MTPDETIATIERLRAMGATRIVVAGVEVEFPSECRPAPVPAPERVSSDELARRAREDEESLMFAACG